MAIKFKNKFGQVTIFIIIAIVLVGMVVVFFAFKDDLLSTKLPASIEPVYTTFLSCLEEETLIGIDILESQAGYIELPEFEAGSRYMPFGSQLNFLGNPIPYWYYVSGNNIQKEQIPSLKNMEAQLGDFIEEKIRGCSFELYHEQGFMIAMEDAEASIDINNNEVEVDLNMDFEVEKGEDTAFVGSHSISVKSELGNLYDSAREIYNQEQDELFLEGYAVDTLRLYAPVDGVELTCAPLTWGADAVFEDLQEAIELNTLYLRTKGGDYSLSKEENEYFVIDSDVNARFINSKNWASSFDVAPSNGNVLISEPVGNQPGLGILGFCYVPYHFVYDVKYPVLVQVYSGDEIFQFPVAVVLEGNNPREALDIIASEVESSEICENKNTFIKVNAYDSKLNFIDAEISYECFGSVCEIGSTIGGVLESEFPQCVNGHIIARAEGYEEGRFLYSVLEPESADVILNKLYDLDVQIKLDGVDYTKDAIVSFVSEDNSRTVVYPEQKSVELSEGQYEVVVYIYRNSSLKLEASVTEQCLDVPQSGLGGLLGLEEEQCFEINIPEQIVSSVLVGGGKENYYILESELANSNVVEINAGKLPTPTTIEGLQNNYVLFDSKDLGVMFK